MSHRYSERLYGEDQILLTKSLDTALQHSNCANIAYLKEKLDSSQFHKIFSKEDALH